MFDVFIRQHAAGAGVLAALGLAVLEPLLANLVAADVEVPHLLRHAVEAARLRLIDPDGFVGVRDLFDLESPSTLHFNAANIKWALRFFARMDLRIRATLFLFN